MAFLFNLTQRPGIKKDALRFQSIIIVVHSLAQTNDITEVLV